MQGTRGSGHLPSIKKKELLSAAPISAITTSSVLFMSPGDSAKKVGTLFHQPWRGFTVRVSLFCSGVRWNLDMLGGTWNGIVVCRSTEKYLLSQSVYDE